MKPRTTTAEFVEHVYDERVERDNPVFAPHAARYERADASIDRRASVLDAGCGTGYGAALLAATGRAVTGIDASSEAIRLARSEHDAAARFLVADAISLPFADFSFDAVVCFEVIEHVEDPRRLLSELARVLVGGGLLCLSTPNARMERLHARRAGRADNPFHISPLAPRTLKRLLDECFTDVTLFGQTEDRGRLHAALQSLDPLGLRLQIAPQRRARIQHALAPATREAAPRFRFSRMLARTAGITYAEARKP